MRDIGKNIKDLREGKGLTQEELAEKLFVTRQTVSNYETGRTRPDLDMLMSMAEALGTDVNAVLYGPEDAAERDRKLRRFAVKAGCLAALGAVCWYLSGVAAKQQMMSFHIWPSLLVNALLLPVLFGLLGWVVMEAAMIFAGMKPIRGRAAKVIAVLLAVSAVVYLLMVGPALLNLVWPAMPDWVRRMVNGLMLLLMGLRGLFAYRVWALVFGGLLRMIWPERSEG